MGKTPPWISVIRHSPTFSARAISCTSSTKEDEIILRGGTVSDLSRFYSRAPQAFDTSSLPLSWKLFHVEEMTSDPPQVETLRLSPQFPTPTTNAQCWLLPSPSFLLLKTDPSTQAQDPSAPFASVPSLQQFLGSLLRNLMSLFVTKAALSVSSTDHLVNKPGELSSLLTLVETFTHGFLYVNKHIWFYNISNVHSL